MYLIFGGIEECCKLPARGCRACGDLCKHSCTCCRQCCRAAARGCSRFTEKPLSSFVVISSLMSISEIVFLALMWESELLEGCEFPETAWVGVSVWMAGQIGFALLNLTFAPFFQYRVWQRLWNESGAESKLQTQPDVKVDRSMVQSSFRHVFMYDFGVCFYFLALVASFVWSKKGFDWIRAAEGRCNPDGALLSVSAIIGWAFFGIAVLYTCLWYFCRCCSKATTIRGGEQALLDDDEERATLSKR